MIFLASKSPRRREILRKMGVRFRIISSSYKERMISGLTPRQLVLTHARGKARHAKVPAKSGWIMGADTIVWLHGRALGKPRNLNESRQMLRQLSGRANHVYTGIALLHKPSGKMIQGYAKTKVWIRRLSDKEIRDYATRVNPLDKAGGYAIQEGPKIVRRIEGSRSNVVGLPKELFKKMQRAAAEPRKGPLKKNGVRNSNRGPLYRG